MPESRTILEEAAEITSKDRQETYGHPLDNHVRIARFWNAYDANKTVPFSPDTPEDICYKMILVKISREQHMPKRDNRVDICGYAQLVDVIHKTQAES